LHTVNKVDFKIKEILTRGGVMKKLIFLFVLIVVASKAQHTITVDGSGADWLGTASSTVHGTTYSDGEFIYTGKSSDERTDYDGTQESSDNDITEVRFGQDGTYIYMLLKVRDLTDVNYPHVCLVFTNGSSSQNFIGDDSKRSNQNGGAATGLGNSAQNGRLVDIHCSSSGSPVIEMYDGGSWYAPPAGGHQVSFSTSNNLIEARIKLTDLGLTSSSTTKVSLMLCPNRVTWNNDGDGTAWQNDNETNGVDVMTPGGTDGSNAWSRDLSDGDVDNYASVDLGQAPIPIELNSFIARVKDRNVTLNWSTSTEVRNYGFDIERKSINGVWTKVGFVEGNGNSNVPHDYTFIDKNLKNGKYSYRLKQVDTDGSFEYYYTSDVDVKALEKYELNQNFPNPFNPVTNISYTILQPGNVKLTLYNALGQVVKSLINESKDAGTYNYTLTTDGLNSGVYFYKIETTNFTQIRKMIVVK
jgi:hypothetical protein